MKTHKKCYFFRSGNQEGFWVEHPKCKIGDADFVRYSDCQFFTKGEGQIIKVVDRANDVTYFAHPDFPYIQE